MSRKIYQRIPKVSWFAYCVLIPIFLFHFILIVFPSFQTVYSSLTQWSGIGKKTFIGLANYQELMGDVVFWSALFNNIKWMVLFLVIPISLGLVLGYVLSSVKKGRLIYRTIYFLPYIISSAIAGKIFSTFYNSYFGINKVFETLGLSFLSHDWLSKKNALVSVALVDNWHWWGFILVIFMSALQQINPSLYEAAEVEGATSRQKFIYITIPQVKPTLVFVILITIVWSFLSFDYVWIMTQGGPGTELLSTYLYKNSFLKYRSGYASSIAVIQSFLALVVFISFTIIRKIKGTEKDV